MYEGGAFFSPFSGLTFYLFPFFCARVSGTRNLRWLSQDCSRSEGKVSPDVVLI